MEKLLSLYKNLEVIVLNTDIVPKEYQQNFFQKVLQLPEAELEKVILRLYQNIRENNLVKRKHYLSMLNIENQFMNEIINS